MFGDRRGPIGNGEKSGRGLGYCAGYDTPGCTNLKPDFRGAGIGFGRSFNCKRGLGAGRKFRSGNGFGGIRSLDNDYPSEKEFFKMKKELLENELVDINARLENLDK